MLYKYNTYVHRIYILYIEYYKAIQANIQMVQKHGAKMPGAEKPGAEKPGWCRAAGQQGAHTQNRLTRAALPSSLARDIGQ